MLVYTDENEEEEMQWSGQYHDCFPEEWAEDWIEGTGPEECLNCLAFGCMDGVFVGYCSNCALYDYRGTRGRGFASPGIETDYAAVIVALGVDEAQDCQSAFDTYLFDAGELTDEDIYGQTISWEDLIYGSDSVMFSHFEDGYNDF